MRSNSRVPVLLLLVVGFVSGVMFVMSCGRGGSSAVAQAVTDMTGVESRLDQLITLNTQLLTTNSMILSRLGGSVNPNNHPAVAVASAVSICVTQGALAKLSGDGSYDEDGDALSYVWSFLVIPYSSSPKFNDPTVRNPSFQADVEGEYVVRLTVTDGTTSSTSTTRIYVLATCL